MGVYYTVVCDRCKKYFEPSMFKMREIQMSEKASAEVGRFLCEHHLCGSVRMIPEMSCLDGFDDYEEQTTVSDGRD